MSIDINSPSILYIKDTDDHLRQLIYKYEGYPLPENPDETTADYLADLFIHDAAEAFEVEGYLDNLSSPPETDLNRNYIELRYDSVIEKSNYSFIFYAQTYFGIPIWRKGVSVHVKADPLEVTDTVSSFVFDEVVIDTPDAEVLNNYSSITTDTLAALLNISESDEVVINGSENLFITMYDVEKRYNLTIQEGFTTPDYDPTTLPDVNGDLVEGNFYIIREVFFSYPSLGNGLYNWRCFIELSTGSVLYLEVFSASATASLFLYDPITMGNAVAGSDNNTTLDFYKTTGVTLPRLQSPSGGIQELRGDYAFIIDPEDQPNDPLHSPLPILPLPSPPPTPPYEGDPPSEQSPYYFDYHVRSEDFSAVSAYYYVDKFFDFVDSLGLPLTGTDGMLPNSGLPLHIDHRAFDDQNPRSAAGLGSPSGTSTIGIECGRLMYDSNASDYMGIGTSFRMLLHELGHCLSYDHVNSANLGFSHGFGDSLAVLLNDPYSNAPDKGLTFPWIASVTNTNGGWAGMDARRNDYDAAVNLGWYWGGSQNSVSYGTESLLASTFYKIYRGMGGDSSSQPRKIFASRMLVMLILKTVKHLTSNSNPSSAAAFADQIQNRDTDLTPWTPPIQVDNVRIGTTHKVIRWGFEKMAAYNPIPNYPPPNSPSFYTPPHYDIYIEDGRSGDYDYITNFWSTTDIVNRNQNDGTTTFAHQNPIPGATNYLFVKIKNRGTQTATNIEMKAYKCNAGGGNIWPNDWQYLGVINPSSSLPATPTAEMIIGPITWTAPTAFSHTCILITVQCDGDYPNTFYAQTSSITIPDWYLIPNDNNIAQRNMTALPGLYGSETLPDAIVAYPFMVRNPYHDGLHVTLEVQLPAILSENGWSISFVDTGSEFTLEEFDRDGVEINMKFNEGHSFTQEDIINSEDRNIVITINSDMGIIGGMTYYLDPDLGTYIGEG